LLIGSSVPSVRMATLLIRFLSGKGQSGAVWKVGRMVFGKRLEAPGEWYLVLGP